MKKLSLIHCLQAGPSNTLLRNELLTLRSSLGHPGLGLLREAKTLTSLGWRFFPRLDGDSWDVLEPSTIRSGVLGMEEAVRCLSEGGHW